MGVLYKNIETEEILTVGEVRAAYCRLVMEVQGIYSNMTFNEYLNEATSKNGNLRVIREQYIVVGHSYKNRGELICKVFSKEADAYSYVEECLGDNEPQVVIDSDVVRYTTKGNRDVYEINRINHNYFTMVSLCDTGSGARFTVDDYDIDSDAYLQVIGDMYGMLEEDYDAPRDVWFKDKEAGIDIGDEIYRWKIIANK